MISVVTIAMHMLYFSIIVNNLQEAISFQASCKTEHIIKTFKDDDDTLKKCR